MPFLTFFFFNKAIPDNRELFVGTFNCSVCLKEAVRLQAGEHRLRTLRVVLCIMHSGEFPFSKSASAYDPHSLLQQFN